MLLGTMDMLQDNLEKYKMCREEGRHEFEILAGRLNTFIMSQSFLVSAYAVAMGNPNQQWGPVFRAIFPALLSLVGLILAFRATPGIFAACNMIRHWHNRQDKILAADEQLQEYYAFKPQDQTRIHARDIWFAQTSPYIFGISWIVFGLLALILTVPHLR